MIDKFDFRPTQISIHLNKMRKFLTLIAILFLPILAFGIQPVQPTFGGRQAVTFYATNAAAGATTVETAITLTKSQGTGATSTGTSFLISDGKKYHITSITFATLGNATGTAQTTVFSFRINTAGAVTTSSTPIVLQATSATPATSLAWDRFIVPLGEGMEISGSATLQFGITANSTYVTNAPTWYVTITGFEYQ